jgi:hypothetical protein
MKGSVYMDKQREMQARAGAALYMQMWRKRNPERVKSTNARYWAKYSARKRAEKAISIESIEVTTPDSLAESVSKKREVLSNV